MSEPPRCPRGAARFAFGFFVGLVFTTTHWPRLRIDGPVARPDLYIHFVSFAIWTVLAVACAWFGPSLSRRNLLRTLALASVYACFDELSQGIPALGRTVALDDLAANLGGVLIGFCVCVAAGAALNRRPASRAGPFSSDHGVQPREPARTPTRAEEHPR